MAVPAGFCKSRVVKSATARVCAKCGRLEFKRVKEQIRERHLQSMSRRAEARA